MNNDVPSGSVMSRPLARNVRSFAWNPSTWTFVPCVTELRFQPCRISASCGPPSTAHCCFSPVAVVTSMCSHECGLLNSIFVTTPSSLIGRLMSNSAANEWCAMTGAATAATKAPLRTLNQPLTRIGPPSFKPIVQAYPSFRSRQRLLEKLVVEQVLRELDALELEQLGVRLGVPIQVHRDRPRRRERLRVLDRRLVLHAV